MNTALPSVKAHTVSCLRKAKVNPAFVKKAPSGEWQTLIKATSDLQQTSAGTVHYNLESSEAQ